MTIHAADVVLLRPTPDEIREAVRYAIKSAVPYTYNRMDKDAWRRVARVARGKVNETLIRRYASDVLGIVSETEDKSYRDHDAFDFIFNANRGRVEADGKTFHVLTQFLGKTRKPFSVDELLCGVDHPTTDWRRLFPMLIPQDYKEHKDIYVFGVSVEAEPNRRATSALAYPWSAFPDSKEEAPLVDPVIIKKREAAGNKLDVSVSWPALGGGGGAVYEAGSGARLKQFDLKDEGSWTLGGLSSFLALQLDDDAQTRLWKQKAALSLSATDGINSIESEFGSARFREVFPRQEYILYLIGWIGRQDFERSAKAFPKGTGCYFYPPKEHPDDKHAPGTKTDNRYVLPGTLNPIATLMEAQS